VKSTGFINLLVNLSIAASYLFVPNLAKELGASDFLVGVIVATYGLMIFLASYIFGRASDRYGRKLFLNVGLLVAAVAFFSQAFADTLPKLLVARAFAGFAVGMFPAALVAFVYESKRRIGRFSSYGSLGYAIGCFLAGVLAVYRNIFMGSGIVFFLAFLASLRMKETRFMRIDVPRFPTDVIKKNLFIYSSFFLRHAGATMIWAILPLYLASLGATPLWIGVIYFINPITQFLIMRGLDRYGSYHNLIKIGLLLSDVVFISYALANTYYQILPVQFLLGVAWACLYVGSLLLLTKENVERATSIGLLNSTTSLAGIVGPLMGGLVAELYGYKMVMYAAFALAVVSILSFNLRYKPRNP